MFGRSAVVITSNAHNSTREFHEVKRPNDSKISVGLDERTCLVVCLTACLGQVHTLTSVC
jgi:hypothetical protein